MEKVFDTPRALVKFLPGALLGRSFTNEFTGFSMGVLVIPSNFSLERKTYEKGKVKYRFGQNECSFSLAGRKAGGYWGLLGHSQNTLENAWRTARPSKSLVEKLLGRANG